MPSDDHYDLQEQFRRSYRFVVANAALLLPAAALVVVASILTDMLTQGILQALTGLGSEGIGARIPGRVVAAFGWAVLLLMMYGQATGSLTTPTAYLRRVVDLFPALALPPICLAILVMLLVRAMVMSPNITGVTGPPLIMLLGIAVLYLMCVFFFAAPCIMIEGQGYRGWTRSLKLTSGCRGAMCIALTGPWFTAVCIQFYLSRLFGLEFNPSLDMPFGLPEIFLTVIMTPVYLLGVAWKLHIYLAVRNLDDDAGYPL